VVFRLLRRWQDGAGNIPHECGKLPSRCRDECVFVFAFSYESLELSAQSKLSFPGDVPDFLGQAVQPFQEDPAFPCWMTVSVSCFYECSPYMTIAGFGDASPSDGAANGMFTGDKPKVRHYLFCRVETDQVAKFGNGRGGDNKGDAA
jgi:hypothetical protein